MEREKLFQLLDEFKIETPSWGFADTGTRFGKFTPARRRFHHRRKTRRCRNRASATPAVARLSRVHVLWDFKAGTDPN